ATGQHPRPWLPTPSLIVEGPYRFSRNPLYVALTLAQIGLGLLLDDAWIVALSAVSLRVVHFIAVRPEEASLLERFGEPYGRSLTRVRRYLGAGASLPSSSKTSARRSGAVSIVS